MMNIEQERRRLLIELAKQAAAEGKREESLQYLRELTPRVGRGQGGPKPRRPRVPKAVDLASLTGGAERK